MQASDQASRVKDCKGHVVLLAENCHVVRKKLAMVWHLRQVIKHLQGGVMVSVNNRFVKLICRNVERASE
jgi:hypothetical protein